MNSEDFQRHVDFVLKQQAEFDEKMRELEEKQRQNTEDITKLVGAIMNLTLHSQDHDRRIAEVTEQIAELTAAGKNTDARLNSLIAVVERHISDGHRH